MTSACDRITLFNARYPVGTAVRVYDDQDRFVARTRISRPAVEMSDDTAIVMLEGAPHAALLERVAPLRDGYLDVIRCPLDATISGAGRALNIPLALSLLAYSRAEKGCQARPEDVIPDMITVNTSRCPEGVRPVSWARFAGAAEIVINELLQHDQVMAERLDHLAARHANSRPVTPDHGCTLPTEGDIASPSPF